MQEVIAEPGEISLDPCPACDGKEFVETEIPENGPGAGQTIKVPCPLCDGEGVAYVEPGPIPVAVDPRGGF